VLRDVLNSRPVEFQEGSSDPASNARFGPGATYWNAFQSVQTRTARQAHQQGFKLIVPMMRGQQTLRTERPGALRQGGVAGVARGGLDTLAAGLHLHINCFKRNPKLTGDLSAMGRPLLGNALQTMMDMHGMDLPATILDGRFTPQGFKQNG
jgi:hypothetical protein